MRTRAGLAANIEAYERKRRRLEEEHLGKYVVFHDAKFADAFDTAEGQSLRRSNGSRSRRTSSAVSERPARCGSPLLSHSGRTVPLVRAGYPGPGEGQNPLTLTRYGTARTSM